MFSLYSGLFRELKDKSFGAMLEYFNFWHSVVNRSSVITCELIRSTCASLNGSPVGDTCFLYPCHSAALREELGSI